MAQHIKPLYSIYSTTVISCTKPGAKAAAKAEILLTAEAQPTGYFTKISFCCVLTTLLMFFIICKIGGIRTVSCHNNRPAFTE